MLKRRRLIIAARMVICFVIANLAASWSLGQQANQDLIVGLDLKSAVVSGDWSIEDGELSVSDDRARLMLPLVTSESYSMTVEFTRQDGQGSVGVILPVGSKQCVLNLSVFDGDAHGLGVVDGGYARNNTTTVRPGTLQNDHPYRLLIEVQVDESKASVSSTLDGRPLVRWSGETQSLSMFEAWKVPNGNSAGLFTDADVIFHAISARPLNPKMRMTPMPQSVSSTRESGVSVLFDLGHGQRNPTRLSTFLTQTGHDFKTSQKPLSTETLEGFDVLVLQGPKSGLSQKEIESVRGFVSSGGSLLVGMDEERRTPLETSAVNDLLQTFGMELTEDTPYLHNCGGVAVSLPRPMAIHAQELELPYSGGRAVRGGEPFAFRLDESGERAEPMAACFIDREGGRVVVLSDLMPLILMGTAEGERLSGVPRDPSRTVYWGKDSRLFVRDVMAWLSAQ